MSVSAYLRHPFTLLAAVSLVIGAIWFALGYPLQMPPSPLAAGEKLGCVTYSPEPEGEPAEIPPERIEADLARLAPFAACVRTYETGRGFNRVPEIAARHGMTVLQGLTLGRDPEANRDEMERAAALAQTQRAAIRAFVAGDGILSRREMRTSELALLVRQLRQQTKIPVTSSDYLDPWLDADLLAATVDFITLKVPLYDAAFPTFASGAARRVIDAHAMLAVKFPEKEEVLIEVGWPSEGRMREGAHPSPAAQAFVLHEVLAAARTGEFQLNLFEGIDRPERAATAGTAGAHWGYIASDTGAPKFRFGGRTVNHPLWFMQAATGVLLAFVVFAAGYLAARSAGTVAPASVKWEPVAAIALGCAFTGWAVADLPVQSHSAADWILNSILLLLAVAVPPVCAAAVVRGVPFEGFGAILDPVARRAAHPLSRAVSAAFVVTVFFALQAGLVIALVPDGRDFPFAPLTGPAVALLTVALANPAGLRRDSTAEPGATVVLALCVLLLVFNESFWNWQALWLAAALGALALACGRAARGQRP